MKADTHTAVRSPCSDVTCVVIGGGQAGLAASRCLDEQGIDHVILERGEVANTWRTERWDSLKLLTPNWQCQLPGYQYSGERPDDYMAVAELVEFLEGYARHISAPVHTGTEVLNVSLVDDAYQVDTNRGRWRCRTVVVAGGAYNIPVMPGCSEGLPSSIHSLNALSYRSPEQLDDGGVLVVGASATGVQFAREIQHSGRPVTLCVGEHVRMPRRYRGRDILSWMDRVGLLDEGYQEVDDIRRARRVPSPQLVGDDNGSAVDLNSLSDIGVRLAGRLAGVHDDKLQFSGSLPNICKLADLKMNRLLRGIDDWISESGLNGQTPLAEEFANTVVAEEPMLELKLATGEIKTVIWACGFRPDYSWLDVPVMDHKGRIKHDGGVGEVPGLYMMGLPYMRRRKSGFIYGTGDDARDITNHLQNYVRKASTAKGSAVA